MICHKLGITRTRHAASQCKSLYEGMRWAEGKANRKIQFQRNDFLRNVNLISSWSQSQWQWKCNAHIVLFVALLVLRMEMETPHHGGRPDSDCNWHLHFTWPGQIVSVAATSCQQPATATSCETLWNNTDALAYYYWTTDNSLYSYFAFRCSVPAFCILRFLQTTIGLQYCEMRNATTTRRPQDKKQVQWGTRARRNPHAKTSGQGRDHKRIWKEEKGVAGRL